MSWLDSIPVFYIVIRMNMKVKENAHVPGEQNSSRFLPPFFTRLKGAYRQGVADLFEGRENPPLFHWQRTHRHPFRRTRCVVR